jgi:hypothetical protein
MAARSAGGILPGGRRWFVGGALLSLVTMPLTATWFLALGGLVVGVTSLVQVLRHDPTWSGGQLLGLGLLVGPAVYLGAALIT